MMIKTFIIDDNNDELNEMRRLLESDNFYEQIEIVGQAGTFEQAYEYLLVHHEKIDLVISDIALNAETTRAEETSAAMLFAELDKALRALPTPGHIGFGVILITLHDDIWPINLLAMNLLPETFCGLISKRGFRGRNIQEQLAILLDNIFRQKFEWRRTGSPEFRRRALPTLATENAIDTPAENQLFERGKWYFSRYLTDHLNQRIRVYPHDPNAHNFVVSRRDIIAFKIEDGFSTLYYRDAENAVSVVAIGETRVELLQDYQVADLTREDIPSDCLVQTHADWYVYLHHAWGYTYTNSEGVRPHGGFLLLPGLEVPISTARTRDRILAIIEFQ